MGFRGPTDVIVGRVMHFLVFYSRSSADRSKKSKWWPCDFLVGSSATSQPQVARTCDVDVAGNRFVLTVTGTTSTGPLSTSISYVSFHFIGRFLWESCAYLYLTLDCHIQVASQARREHYLWCPWYACFFLLNFILNVISTIQTAFLDLIMWKSRFDGDWYLICK